MIYTFYSYKGGVGRSMALANVAKAMSLLGRRVVMVDWDLEAPGLETFFYESASDLQGVQTAFGVLDLLLAYKEEFPTLAATAAADEDRAGVLARNLAPLRRRLIAVVPPETPEGGGVWLLPAGWRAGARFDHYARMVQSFDWEEFYADYWGADYFEWLRAQVTAPDVAHDVLVDSRTGITEMGGVCTRQLADVVVSFCAPNQQNLDGVVSMSQSFVRKDLRDARGRPLQVVVVPTRIDNSENDSRLAFERTFRERLDEYTPVAFRAANRSFWDLKIPYIPKYAYQESLAVGAPNPSEELVDAYQRLTAHLLLLAPDDVTPRSVWASAAVWGVPHPRDPNFVDREEQLRQIEELLNRRERDVTVATVHGLRAVGKTALAAEYVHRHRAKFDLVWWLRAKDPASLAHDIRALASALDLPLGSDDETSSAVRRWLERSSRWLLVVDDAGEPADVEWFLPTTGSGEVIVVSSKTAGWRKLGALVEVPPLPTDAAVAFLARRTGVPVTEDGLKEVADALGGLPLALEHAAAYLEVSGTTPTDYAAQLRDPTSAAIRSQSALQEVLQEALAAISGPAIPVRDVLHLYAQLEEHGVPVELLEVPGRLEPDAVASAIRQLTQSGLAHVDHGMLVVHPLLPTAVGARAGSNVSSYWADTAVRRVNEAFPGDVEAPDSRERCARLVRHALAASRRAPQAHDARRAVLPRVARYLRLEGRLADAQEALDLTPPHPGLGQAMEAVVEQGLLAQAFGRWDVAEKTFGDLAASAPPSSHALANALTHLGTIQWLSGQDEKALATLERALPVAEALPGESLLVADTLVALASAQGSVGRLEEARQRVTRAVRLREAALGPNHPAVGSALHRLGYISVQAGDISAGRQAMERALRIGEAALGPDHPRVATALLLDGAGLIEAFEPGAAVPVLERALAIRETIFGPESIHAGEVLLMLGEAQRDLGDEVSARSVLARGLAVLGRVVGVDHPVYRRARLLSDSLDGKLDRRRRMEDATRRGRAGDLLLLSEEGLHGHEQVVRRLDAARILRILDRLGAAQQLLEQLLSATPDDGATLYELGYVLFRLGDTIGADARLRRAAEAARGDDDALSLVGKVDKLRWRLRWGNLPDEARLKAASEWADLAVQARSSFERAFQRDPSAFLDAIEALALEVLLDELGVPFERPDGLLRQVRTDIDIVRKPSAPRSDREKVQWIQGTAAMAELALLTGDDARAARFYRTLAFDESVRLFELDAAAEQLSLYLALGHSQETVASALEAIEAAGDLVLGGPSGSFTEVAVVLGHAAPHHLSPGAAIGPGHASQHNLFVCAGVSAADVLMAEAALAEGSATVRLLLPTDVAGCKTEVARRAGAAMVARFEALLPKCQVRVQSEVLGPPPEGADPYVRSQQWCVYEGWVEADPGHLTTYFYGPPAPPVAQTAAWAGAKVVPNELY